MYQENIFITSNDVDNHYDLKISSLFKYLQQVSTNHAEKIGLGKKDTVDKGMFWVITRMKVIIYKMPKMLETIKVTTHPGNILMFVFPRFYEVYSEEGELLVAASSSWALLDIDTHKAIMKPNVDYSLYVEEKLDEDISLPEKVSFDNLEKIEERKVRYSDIDLNGHLNNTKYIEYIVDTHDINFYQNKHIKEIVINYEREIKDGDIVTIYSDHQEEETIVGDVEGKHSFIAKVTYIKR